MITVGHCGVFGCIGHIPRATEEDALGCCLARVILVAFLSEEEARAPGHCHGNQHSSPR